MRPKVGRTASTAALRIGPSEVPFWPLSMLWTMPARAALKAAYSTMIRACCSMVSWMAQRMRKIIAGRIRAASTIA